MRRPFYRWDDFFHPAEAPWTAYYVIELIAAIVLFFGGLLGWGYVISESGGSLKRLLIAEIVVQAVVLAGSIFRIGFFDYEEHIRYHIRLTFAVDTLLSVIGYYIANIHVMKVTGAVPAEIFYYIIDFLVEILIAMVLGFLPSVIIALLMWVLVRIFARPL